VVSNIRSRLPLVLAVLTLAAAGVPSLGSASTITLTGSGGMSYLEQFLWNGTDTPGNDYDLSVPGQYTFTDTFLSQQPASPNLGTSGVGAYDFQDSYRFTIGSGATGDTLIASLGLANTFNIADLQFRLYEVPTSTTAPVVGAIPTGPGYETITGWMGAPSGSNEIQASFADIQAGTYILDVAGIANGTNGGTYFGQLNINTPVPLPAGLPLLLSGLGALWAVTRKRRALQPLGAA